VLGVEVVGASQLMDDPKQEAGVSMIDWVTGKATARLWVVKLLVEGVGQGDWMQVTEVNVGMERMVYGQAFVSEGGKRVILLINKVGLTNTVYLKDAGLSPSQTTVAQVVDELSGFSPPRQIIITDAEIILLPYATAIVTIPN